MFGNRSALRSAVSAASVLVSPETVRVLPAVRVETGKEIVSKVREPGNVQVRVAELPVDFQ